MRITKQFKDLWEWRNLPNCLWHEENPEERDLWPTDPNDEHRWPCLGYHDPDTEHNCAMCKPGLARIFVEYDHNGVKNQWVICGSVRTKERDASTGAYSYLDPDTVTTD